MRETILAPCMSYLNQAKEHEEKAKELHALAKKARWEHAPAWANVIVKPNPRFYKEGKSYASSNKARPTHADDWRWAESTSFGWYYFGEGPNGLCSSKESGNWIVWEER